MRKYLTAGLAALTFGAAVVGAAAPAEARPHDGGRYYYGHRHNNSGAAIAAGVAGLALGAALASNSGHTYYRGGYYRGGYYRGGYGYYDPGYDDYDGGYAVCESSRWVWDPYIGRRVLVRSHYAC
jgi:hypothetical protein